ncbi:hypothetical protein [Inquilinus sp. CA228]|uniref:hypothetical protein n=1 Tax=Inquilinus sp. CA228 TaxID=3455609 RepID=UPI003F8D1CB4
MSIRIELPSTVTRPGMPAYWGDNPLADLPNCIAAYDFTSQGDQSDNGHDITGSFPAPTTEGWALPGGASGLSFSLIPPNPEVSGIIAFKIATSAAADGFLFSCRHPTENRGFALRWNNAASAMQLQVKDPGGTVLTTLVAPAMVIAKNTWYIVGFRTHSPLSSVAAFIWINYAGSNNNSVTPTFFTGPKLAITTPVLLNDNTDGAVTGPPCTVGACAFYDSTMTTAEIRSAMQVAADHMLDVHGVTITVSPT